jgi:hypothetical protein
VHPVTYTGRNHGKAGAKRPAAHRRYGAGYKFPTAGQECIKGCGRWRQGRDGLCRRCRASEARVITEAPAIAPIAPPRDLFPPAGSPKTRIINGVEFEVVFDGT